MPDRHMARTHNRDLIGRGRGLSVNFFFIPNSFPNARFYQKSCIRNGPRSGVQVTDEVRKKILRILTQFILDPGDQGARAEKLTIDGVSVYRLRIDRAYRMHLERRNNILIIRAIGAHRLEGIG